MAKKKVEKKKKKGKKVAPAKGNAYIYSSYNNTIISLADQNGNVLTQSSAGRVGFKGPKKATAYAAQVVVKDAVVRAIEMGLKEVNVFVKGIGSGRESAIRALNSNGLIVTSIKDMTPLPHNGCRAKKPRKP